MALTSELLPYHLARDLTTGETVEIISKPVGDGTIYVREPGDPTTLRITDVSNIECVLTVCNRDGRVWRGHVVGEFNNAHIDCPECGRGYYWNNNIKAFVSDRKLGTKKP